MTARAVPAVHQLVAGFRAGDAISSQALVLQALFRDLGYASEIFTDRRRVPDQDRSRVADLDALRPAPGDTALLHLSIGSPVNLRFARLPCRRLLLYHNITPPAWFEGLSESTARELALGLEQAAELAGTVHRAFAVSAYNARELEALGHRDVGVIPLWLDLSAHEARPDARRLRRWSDGRLNLAFVGRVAPNKRFEDLLAAFYHVKRFVAPDARLLLVGASNGLERYRDELIAWARMLEIEDIAWLGSVSFQELLAVYRAADVFLCLSEHEGFCAPLIEAMKNDVPVVAYAAAAVPETLDGAGILLREKRFDALAEIVARLRTDAALRAAVLARQRERIARYEAYDFRSAWRDAVAPDASGDAVAPGSLR